MQFYLAFQVFLGLVNLYFTSSFPLNEFYANGNSGLDDQQFFYNYQPRSVYYYPNDINKPSFIPQMGMSPQYHNLVYNYVKDFAGTEPPVHVNTFQPNIITNKDQYPSQNVPDQFENFGEDKAPSETESQAPGASVADETTDKPGLQEYFIPSDYLSLPNNPNSQFYGQFDAIKMKRMKVNSYSTSLPPIGGVVSNYALLRTHQNYQNLLQLPGTLKGNDANLQHIKRQTDNSDGVVILAEPTQSTKTAEDCEKQKEEVKEDKEEEMQMETNPGIAQSKPSAIALAGPGGVAQASPVGTALVGQGGLAVAAPSGTAVAGPAGQNVPIHFGGEKQKVPDKETEKTTEKSEESEQSDSF